CGRDIHLWARLTAVADVYDALMSDRPYRKNYRPHEALKIILEDMRGKLDEVAVLHLIKNLALFPQGTVVKLNTGHVGIVCRQTTHSALPVVRVLADSKKLLAAPYEVDLSQDG